MECKGRPKTLLGQWTSINCQTHVDNLATFDKNCSLQDARDSDEDDDRLEAVKSNQFEQSEHYIMADDHPEQRCLTSSSKSVKRKMITNYIFVVNS